MYILLFISSFYVLSISPDPAAGGVTSCAPLESRVIDRRVSQVMSSADRDDIADGLILLEDYWASLCRRSKANADRSTVDSIVRLLERRNSRGSAAAMLLDVRRNLPRARRPLEAALADEIRYDRAAVEAAGSIPLVSYSGISDFLRCVLHKIRTGRRNRGLCQLLELRTRPPQ
jgi:hypothetical protein